MAAPAPRGVTPYETWVLTLRAWALDPLTSLDDLPPLADDTFAPDTYRRLLHHVQLAMDEVAGRWSRGVAKAFENHTSTFELTRDLTSLRAGLARQWQLATHPSLPEGLRGPLSDGVRRRALESQRQLEESVREQIRRSGTDRPGLEQALRALREASLSRVVDHRLGDDGRMGITTPTPSVSLPAPRRGESGSRERTNRFTHRRILGD